MKIGKYNSTVRQTLEEVSAGTCIQVRMLIGRDLTHRTCLVLKREDEPTYPVVDLQSGDIHFLMGDKEVIVYSDAYVELHET